MAYISNAQLQKMTFNQIGRAITSGALSERRLKDYFTSARKTAMDRSRKLSKTREFGTIEKEYFQTLRGLPTLQALVRETADINAYLNSQNSTRKGLKARREKYLSTLEKHKMNFINTTNYGEFIDFIEWFKKSEFVKYYDSQDDEFETVFLMAESATPEEWAKLFRAFGDKKKKKKGSRK